MITESSRTLTVGGRINRTVVTPGNLVGENASSPTLLTTIVRVDELFVYFDAPEAEFVQVFYL